MSSYLWLRPLAHRLLGRPTRKASSTRPIVSSRRRVRPCLETLEDRITPNNTFTPTTFADDPTKGFTLREAISASNADTGTATVTVNLAAGVYELTLPNTNGYDGSNASGDLNITSGPHEVIIQGVAIAGQPQTFIQQTVADRVFDIGTSNNEKVILRNLVIQGGRAQDDAVNGRAPGSSNAVGGGIMVNARGSPSLINKTSGGGFVTLSNVVLQGNSASAGSGFAGLGGGIFVIGGSLTIRNNSEIEDNKAFGGAVTTNPQSGFAAGGGVFGSGANISISGSNVSGDAVTGGNAINANGGNASGGAVYDSDGFLSGGLVFGTANLSISGSNVSGNTVTGGSSSNGNGGSAAGGAVYDFDGQSSASLTLLNCNLGSNTLTGGNGDLAGTTNDFPGDIGGKALGGGVFSFGTTTITDSTLTGNTLTGGNGSISNNSIVHLISVGNDTSIPPPVDVGGEALGGAAFVGGVSATIAQCILSNNSLNGGNGTYVGGTVTGNIGGSASGGGVYVSTSGITTPTLGISDSTLSGNFVSGGNGSLSGAAKISGDGGIPLAGFASGGGVSISDAGNATVTIVNSTIADNQVTGGGGGPSSPAAAGGGLFFGSTTTATLTNDTIVGNQANPPLTGSGSTSGGGIDNAGGKVTLVNTLAALNGAGLGPDFAGTVTNSDHNLISVDDGSSGFSAAHGDLLGTESHFLNPGIGSLANNSGSTQTIALLSNSPAINAGDNDAELATGSFDQRGLGFPRVSGGTIDIGAFEFQVKQLVSPPPPPNGGGPSPSPAPPPTLHTPPLLAFFDSLLAAVETGNANGTWTVTDNFFGIPLLVSTYGSAGNLMSVTLFGINVTFLFESL